MGRHHNPTVPNHAAIDPEPYPVFKNGKTIWSAKVCCPDCKTERLMSLTYLRQQAERKNFTGRCLGCGAGATKGKPRDRTQGAVTSHGYVNVTRRVARDPQDITLIAQIIAATHQEHVYEHQLVMVKHLGRMLYSDERIKHRDGNRSNNNINNLELNSSGEPLSHRVADLVAWAKEITRRYGALAFTGNVVLGEPTA